MRFFRRNPRKTYEGTPPPVQEMPPPAREPDLHELARPALAAEAATNPRLAALLAEIDRGRARRASSSDTSPTPAPEPTPTPTPEPLHAHEVTADDAALIRMMKGAHFGDGFTLVLPSGKAITGAEMCRWVEQQDGSQTGP